jgi:hypothetical protein
MAFGRKPSALIQPGSPTRAVSIAGIFQEAWRSPKASRHVAHRRLPSVWYAKEDPLKILADVLREADEIRVPVAQKDPTLPVRLRRLRQDALLMAVGVVSFEADLLETPDVYERAVADTVRYLHDTHAEHLVLIIEHRDEAHPHLHYFLKAPPHPTRGIDIDAVHPGLAARRDAQARGEPASAAYQQAMEEFQLQYYLAVSQPLGIAHTSIKRPRYRRLVALLKRVDLELLTTQTLDLSNRAGRDLQLAKKQLAAYEAGTWQPIPEAIADWEHQQAKRRKAEEKLAALVKPVQSQDPLQEVIAEEVTGDTSPEASDLTVMGLTHADGSFAIPQQPALKKAKAAIKPTKEQILQSVGHRLFDKDFTLEEPLTPAARAALEVFENHIAGRARLKANLLRIENSKTEQAKMEAPTLGIAEEQSPESDLLPNNDPDEPEAKPVSGSGYDPF